MIHHSVLQPQRQWPEALRVFFSPLRGARFLGLRLRLPVWIASAGLGLRHSPAFAVDSPQVLLATWRTGAAGVPAVF
jgi:hypothetical protein